MRRFLTSLVKTTHDKLRVPLSGILGRPRAAPPSVPSTEPALDELNQQFHASYDAQRERARREGPVFVVVADQLVLFRHGERCAWSFSPRAFHLIKSVAHVPVLLYTAWREPPAPTSAHVIRLRARIAEAEHNVSDELLDEATHDDLRRVLAGCLAMLDVGQQGAPSAEQRDAFAAAMGAPLLRLVHAATRLQLAALHEHTEHAVAQLSPEEQSALHAVVAGDHQARVRSLGMQYFRKRFAHLPDVEQRVSYAEGVSDERGALALVGTQRLDRDLARAFFGDEQRMQRDILGDAATQILDSFDLAATRS